VDALKVALHRGDWLSPLLTRKARAAAATSLRRIGTAQALEVLKHAASSGSRGTRRAARAQLSDLP
jgi:HEAT repeat protein